MVTANEQETSHTVQPSGTGTAAQASGWSASGVGSRWQIRFFRLLLRLGGKRPAYHIMYVVVLGYAVFSPAIRRRTRFYLSRRFPDRRRPWHCHWDSYRLLCEFGRCLLDRAALALLGDHALRASCPDEDALVGLRDGAEGIVLVNAHVGCWQVAMSCLHILAKPVALVMLPPEENLAHGPRPAEAPAPRPFRIIDPREGLAAVVEMMQALKRGEIVGVMGDRIFGSAEKTVPARLLGGRIALPLSPYRLASATGVPIAVLLTHKTGFSTYEIRLARVIRVPPHLGAAPAAYEPYAQQFADALEAFAMDHPWQFFNFYDLWAEPTAETAREPENASAG